MEKKFDDLHGDFATLSIRICWTRGPRKMPIVMVWVVWQDPVSLMVDSVRCLIAG
jgi:hypothetical protein